MREIIIENEKYISVITNRLSSCDGCDLKGLYCLNRKKYGIIECFIGNSPIIFKRVDVPTTIKQEIETLLHLKISKDKIMEKYNLTQEQFDYIVNRKV